jgi:uncharacterized protein YkwD
MEQNTFRSGKVMELLPLVNQVRAEARTCGDIQFPAAEPLQWNDKLGTTALDHAEDMARKRYFSHTGENGSSLTDRVLRTGYAYGNVGENIAATENARSAVELWLTSPTHCANLMKADFTEMGAAFALGSAKDWETRWVLVLGKRR